MASQLIVTLPDKVLEQIESRARAENRPVVELVADVLQSSFVPVPKNSEQEAMEQEMAAYQAMHSQIVTQYENQFVAIFGGRIVDSDADQMALIHRRLENYPDDTVMTTRVRPNPIHTLDIRSPTLVRHTS